MPARLFLIGKDTGGNSPPPTPGLGAYCFRVWGPGASQWLLPGMEQGLVGCRVFFPFKQIFRHTETPLSSSSTNQARYSVGKLYH